MLTPQHPPPLPQPCLQLQLPCPQALASSCCRLPLRGQHGDVPILPACCAGFSSPSPSTLCLSVLHQCPLLALTPAGQADLSLWHRQNNTRASATGSQLCVVPWEVPGHWGPPRLCAVCASATGCPGSAPGGPSVFRTPNTPCVLPHPNPSPGMLDCVLWPCRSGGYTGSLWRVRGSPVPIPAALGPWSLLPLPWPTAPGSWRPVPGVPPSPP